MYLLTVILGFLIISEITILIFTIKNGKFIKTLLFNAFLGITVLIIINLTNVYTNIYLPINKITVFSSGVLGIPGVCGLLILHFIMLF